MVWIVLFERIDEYMCQHLQNEVIHVTTPKVGILAILINISDSINFQMSCKISPKCKLNCQPSVAFKPNDIQHVLHILLYFLLIQPIFTWGRFLASCCLYSQVVSEAAIATSSLPPQISSRPAQCNSQNQSLSSCSISQMRPTVFPQTS